jgi:hypothetical protein
MTNPTSNFGWQMPTATDLVTSLPADFEVFGQAVDTDLADLNGGTTGQVLSKTSATDLDFTWVDTDDTNAIQNAIVTAKGDLIGASASATPLVLAVGADGTQLVADSAEATGLKWATAASGGGMTLLSTTTLSGASTTISSISGSYTNLLLVLYGLNPSNTVGTYLYPNGTSNLVDMTYAAAYGASLVVESQRAAGLTWNGGQNMLAGNTANGASILFYNYADTSIAYKTFSFQGRSVSTASPATNTNAGGGTIATSSAITSIQIGMGSGTFTGGTALLYGVL